MINRLFVNTPTSCCLCHLAVFKTINSYPIFIVRGYCKETNKWWPNIFCSVSKGSHSFIWLIISSFPFAGVSVTTVFLSLHSGTLQFEFCFFFPWSRGVILSSKSHLNLTVTHSLAALKLWIYRQRMTLGNEIHLIPLIMVPVWLSEGQSSFHAWLCLPAHCEAQPMDCLGFTSVVGLWNPWVVNSWVSSC